MIFEEYIYIYIYDRSLLLLYFSAIFIAYELFFLEYFSSEEPEIRGRRQQSLDNPYREGRGGLKYLDFGWDPLYYPVYLEIY